MTSTGQHAAGDDQRRADADHGEQRGCGERADPLEQEFGGLERGDARRQHARVDDTMDQGVGDRVRQRERRPPDGDERHRRRRRRDHPDERDRYAGEREGRGTRGGQASAAGERERERHRHGGAEARGGHQDADPGVPEMEQLDRHDDGERRPQPACQRPGAAEDQERPGTPRHELEAGGDAPEPADGGQQADGVDAAQLRPHRIDQRGGEDEGDGGGAGDVLSRDHGEREAARQRPDGLRERLRGGHRAGDRGQLPRGARERGQQRRLDGPVRRGQDRVDPDDGDDDGERCLAGHGEAGRRHRQAPAEREAA
jgi:hypothetical protein